MNLAPSSTEPVAALLAIVALLLAAPLLGRRLGLSGSLLIVGAGFLAGPSGLGLLGDAEGLRYLAAIGGAYALAQAGAELEFGQARRRRDRGALAGLLAFVLAAGATGAAAAFALGAPPLAAVALALVLSSSTAPVRLPPGRAGSLPRARLAASSSAALADSVAVLAVFAAGAWGLGAPEAAAGPSAGVFGLLLGIERASLAALAMAAAILVLPRASALFFKLAKPDGEIEFAFTLVLALACATLAGLGGFEPLAGAFVGGAILGRFIADDSPLMGRLRFAGNYLLSPFLLAAAGFALEPAALGPGSGLGARLGSAAWLLGALLAARAAAAFLRARLSGLGAAEAVAVLGLSMADPLVPLALLLAARGMGLVGSEGYAAATLALLAASVAGTAIAHRPVQDREAEGAGAEGAEATRPDRIMVAVSNPVTLRGLLEVAFLLRRKGSAEAVHPIAMVPDAEADEAELGRVENLLAQALVIGDQERVPMKPSTKVCLNVAEGLLEAAAEASAGTIVVGWNRAPRLSKAFFGTLIERLVRDARELVVVSRPSKGRGFGRLALVLPPLAERHPGFRRGVEALGALASRAGSSVTVFVQKPCAPALREAVAPLRGRGPAQLVELESWKDSPRAIAGATAPFDAIALFCARPGGPAWHPAAEQLPAILEEEFPAAAIDLFYLPEAERCSGCEGDEESGGDVLAAAIAAGRVIPAMRDAAVADGVRSLLATAFGADRRLLGRLTAIFTEIAQKQPIELEPGVLLLHAHVSEVTEPTLFFGSKPSGFRLIALEEPVRVLVLLCAPEGQPPEAHLAVLGEIAGLFKDGGLAERLVAARSAGELADSAPDERR